MLLRILLVALTVLAGVPRGAAAQVDAVPTPAAGDSTVEVRLRDGSVLYGQVVAQDDSTIVLLTSTGARLALPRAQIVRLRVVTGRDADGAHWEADPNSTRLFFTSTARPLAKGEGYISSYMLFFPFVAYGVTDRITLAGGTPILPGLIGEVFYVAPKVTLLDRGRASVAVGALGLWVPDVLDEGSIGIIYGAGTWGSRDRAITAGAGWGYASGAGSSGISNDPVFMIGGETRVSRRVKLITENWLFVGGSQTGGLVSGGFRFIGDRISADLGFGGALGESQACCIPLVNFVYSFGGQGRPIAP
jgi:hypothetical protein